MTVIDVKRSNKLYPESVSFEGFVRHEVFWDLWSEESKAPPYTPSLYAGEKLFCPFGFDLIIFLVMLTCVTRRGSVREVDENGFGSADQKRFRSTSIKVISVRMVSGRAWAVYWRISLFIIYLGVRLRIEWRLSSAVLSFHLINMK